MLAMTTELRSLIDKNIDEHLSAVRDLRARRNLLSPIFHLPLEVLESIFIHCARDYHYKTEYPHRIRDVPSWVNVSYVCQHWRHVALNCAALWTYHFVLSLRWTDELLARSKQASLKIRMAIGAGNFVRINESWWLALLQLLMNHAERIQELHLQLHYGIAPETLFKLFTHSRRLQSLDIDVVQDEPGSFYDTPTILVDGETGPALRKLKLQRCRVPWYSLTLSALTTLDLFDIPFNFRKSSAELLSMLGSMQNLMHLYLDRAMSHTPLPADVSGNSLSKIDLPRLTRLFVSASLPTIVTLLSRLAIPLQAEVRFNCRYHEEDGHLEDYSSLSSLLAHRLNTSYDPTSSLPTIRSIVVQCAAHENTRELALIVSTSERDCKFRRFRAGMSFWYNTEWDCDIPLKIIVDVSRKWNESCRIVSDICRPLPLENVQSLRITSLGISQGFFRGVLERSPRLQHIKLAQCKWLEYDSRPSVSPQNHIENQSGGGHQQPDDEIHEHALEEMELERMDLRVNITRPRHAQAAIQSFWDTLFTPNTRFKVKMTKCKIEELEGNPSGYALEEGVGWWEDGELTVDVDEEPEDDYGQ